MRGSVFTVLVLCVLAGAGCVTDGGHEFDGGPVVAVDKDVHGSSRTRILGPLLETRTNDNGMKFVAVRPFYSRTDDPGRERSVSDFVWPLGMMKELKGEMDWRFFPSLGHDDDMHDSEARHRWYVFPLLYGGQGINGDKYFAFFPLGGTIYDFMGRDKVGFFLFPLYSCSEQEDNKTQTVLWPFFSMTRGDDVFRWRVFPFYGVSKNKGRWTKRFVLWPFWTSVKYHWEDGDMPAAGNGNKLEDAEKNTGGGFILWPLFGKTDVGEYYSRSFLPPFFKWEVGKDGHRALFCPWPIIRYKRGKVNQFYVWPLIGKKTISNDKRWFVLWPIGSWRRVDRENYVLRRWSIMPLLSYESKTARIRGMGKGKAVPVTDEEAGEVFERFFKFWPLLSYQRKRDVLRFRMLALWPIKNAPAINRNWAPLWSLYTHERNGSMTDTEILWGLYRHQCSENSRRLSVFPLLQTSAAIDETGDKSKRSWSLLYGLIGYKRDGLQKQFKMLYFLKFGKLEKD